MNKYFILAIALTISASAHAENKGLFASIFGDTEHDDEEIMGTVEQDAPVPNALEQTSNGKFYPSAKINIIDRSLGKTYHYSIDLGSSVRFNELEINALKCWKPDEYSFVNQARTLLKIHDYKNIPNKFHGWIIANHPGTSYYEHEKYDILVAGCDETTAMINAVEEAPANSDFKPQ